MSAPDDPDMEIEGYDLGPRRDQNFLANAAHRVDLPADTTTDFEHRFFSELWSFPKGEEVFLLIRNTALVQWQCDIFHECTVTDVKNRLRSPFNANVPLITKVVHYLTCHGYINFGIYEQRTVLRHFNPEEKNTAVVIGAGAAGIAAATQLQAFGFKVIILEGKSTVGGRCQSFAFRGNIIETGCDAVRNLDCSPMLTLVSQLNVELFTPNPTHINCYAKGIKVDAHREQLARLLYDHLHCALNYLAHQGEQRDEGERFVSRQRGFENILSLVERNAIINYFNYCNTASKMATKRAHHYDEMKHWRTIALAAEEKIKTVAPNDRLMKRSLKYDLKMSMGKFQEALDAFQLCQNHLKAHKKKPAVAQYMQPKDYNNHNFLLGIEELDYGTQLERIQFSRHTSNRRWKGPGVRIDSGMAQLFQNIVRARQIDVRGNRKVISINYSNPKVVILETENDEGEVSPVIATVVVSTIPLGVLKKSVENDARGPKFIPQLPATKQEAIKGICVGVTNKLCLVFDTNFWEEISGSSFANVNSNLAHRAFMHYWSSTPGSKVLYTYYVGEPSVHEFPDGYLIEYAMNILREIFPEVCPKAPLKSYVTRWHEDPFAFGSGSFMGLRTEVKHYEDLIEPLASPDGVNRVYFAGEHTSMEHGNTVKGAWLSGMHVAREIATDHNGPDWVNTANTEIVGRSFRTLEEEEIKQEALASDSTPSVPEVLELVVEPSPTVTVNIGKITPLTQFGPGPQPLIKRIRFDGREFQAMIPDDMSRKLHDAYVSHREGGDEDDELIELSDSDESLTLFAGPSTSASTSRARVPQPQSASQPRSLSKQFLDILRAEREADARAKARSQSQVRAQGQTPARVPAPAQGQFRVPPQSAGRTPSQARGQPRVPSQSPARTAAEAHARTAANAMAQAQKEAQARAEARAKTKAQAQAKAMAHSEALAKAQAEARALAIAQGPPPARSQAQAQARAEAQARALALEKAKAQTKAKAQSGPSTPSSRPSTSQYVSSRPSTSAYANPSRQVPPTRTQFDTEFPHRTSAPVLPERPPASAPARPPSSRMQKRGGHK